MATQPAAIEPGTRPVIVYDGRCAFCRRQMERTQRLDRGRGSFEYLAAQSPDLLQRFPQLTGADFNSGLRVVLADGSVHAGADAVYQMARRLPVWRRLAWAYRAPGVGWLARRVYAWVAANRNRLAGRCDDGCAVRPPDSGAN